MLETVVNYFAKGSIVTIFVVALLSVYFVTVFWIFLYRHFYLGSWQTREKEAVEALLKDPNRLPVSSILHNCINPHDEPTEKSLQICLRAAIKESTAGLTILSLIASTSPFVGLFGTVVSILDSFSKLGMNSGGASIQVMAPAISEALVATAVGIFVAIPAYSFHLLLKRKAFEITTYVQMQIDILTTRT